MDTTWNLTTQPSLEGKTAVVTGAATGIGYETALALAGKKAEVILAARNRRKAEEAMASIRKNFPLADLHFRHLDLGSLSSVRNFAGEFSETHDRLHLLINNAGIMMPPYRLTEDGFESQLGTNYLGHFLLTALLVEKMKGIPDSRIVTLSSMAHKYGTIRFDDLQFSKAYNALKAYSQSKLACLIFAYELQRRLEKSNFSTISVGAHPGVSSTHLGRHMSPVLRYFFPRVGQPAAYGALPVLMAALAPSVKGGEYYGPGGWNEMRGKPVLVGSSKISKDPLLATRLWKISEQLVGQEFLNNAG